MNSWVSLGKGLDVSVEVVMAGYVITAIAFFLQLF
jgi:hypothetical protein